MIYRAYEQQSIFQAPDAEMQIHHAPGRTRAPLQGPRPLPLHCLRSN